jgi:hypothetical protein
MTPISFIFSAPNKIGQRLVEASQGDDLLHKERFDPFQEWQATRFLERVAGRVPYTHTNGYIDSNERRKSVTDVGAVAGSQSRCVDAHIVFRQHQEPDAIVLDAALRSFAPIEPMVLRWQFPLWMPDDSLDPAKLKGKLTATEQRQGARDSDGIVALATALKQGPATARELRRRSGLSKGRCDRLLDQCEASGSIKATEVTIRGNVCRQYESVNLDNFNDSETPF